MANARARYARVGRLLGFIAMLSTIALVLVYASAYLIGSGFAVVEGRSMEPLLHSGDLVVLVESPDYSVGDIVVYERSGKFIIHRILYEYRGPSGVECYVIKGDNNPIPDTGDPVTCGSVYLNGVGYAIGVPETAIVGKVVEIAGTPFKIPYVGILKIVIDNLSESM